MSNGGSRRFGRSVILVWIARIVPWLVLCCAAAVIVTQARVPSYLWKLFVPWAEIGCLALILTPIIVSGGIDLSVGSVMALSGVVMGTLWQDAHWPIWIAALGGVVAGASAGAVNGGLVVMGLSPLVATLATMAFFRGLSMALSGAEQIRGFPQSFVGWAEPGGFQLQYWLLVAGAIVWFVLLHLTRFGRWCFAIGDNRIAARFAAVPVARAEWLLYTAGGLVCGLVGVAHGMRQEVVLPDAHQGIELQAIACVVIGGTLITGGRGGILQSLFGLAVVASLDVALQFIGPAYAKWLTGESRLVVIGFVLVAVAVLNEKAIRSER